MIQQQESEGLIPKTIKEFPALFRGTYHANTMKARNWYDKREKIMDAKSKAVTRYKDGVRKLLPIKTLSGRGPRTQPWVLWLYEILEVEFRRLLKAGVPMNVALVVDIAKALIEESSHDEFNSNFRKLSREDEKMKKQRKSQSGKDGKEIAAEGRTMVEIVNYAWVDHFLRKRTIILRSVTGRAMCSAKKEIFLAKTIAFHLGNLKRDFDGMKIFASEQNNMDETHLLVDQKTKKILTFRGTTQVKYQTVVNGTEGMTVVITIKGGDASAKVGVPLVIFQNDHYNYPLAHVPDNVLGVRYRTQPKAFMDGKIMRQYFLDRDVWGRSASDENRDLWMDNYSGHLFPGIEALLKTLKTTVKFYPPNTTDKLQACDSFVIQKFKEFWRGYWSQWRVSAIRKGDYEESGMLKRPSREWYLQTVKKCVDDLNSQFDVHGMSWAQKAMVLTGTGLPPDGVWKVTMLTQVLQKIVEDFSDYFEGKSPYEEAEEEEVKADEEKGKAKPRKGNSKKRKKKSCFMINFGGMLQQLTMEEYFQNIKVFSGKKKDLKFQKMTNEVIAEVKIKFADHDCISHRALIAYLHEILPEALPIHPGFEPRPARLRYATKMLNSMRGQDEIHDIEVSYLWKVIMAAMHRTPGLQKLHYGQLQPISPQGVALPSAEVLRVDEGVDATTGQPFITLDHFELLIINSELLENPVTRDIGDKILSAGLIHADSLNRRIEEPIVMPVTHMHSQMAQKIASSTGNGVLVVPCVVQPFGCRMCGVCTAVNHLLMVKCNKQQLIDPNCIETQLVKYKLPKRRDWTSHIWVCAGAVLTREYLKGGQSRATVDSLLQDMSAAINTENFVLEELEQCHVGSQSSQSSGSVKRKTKQSTMADFF
jgi:hypothetical protein